MMGVEMRTGSFSAGAKPGYEEMLAALERRTPQWRSAAMPAQCELNGMMRVVQMHAHVGHRQPRPLRGEVACRG